MNLKRIVPAMELAERLGVMKATIYSRNKQGVPKKMRKALIEVIKERQKELDDFILLLEKNETTQ